MSQAPDTQFEVLYRAPGLSPIRMVSILASAFCVAGLFFAYHLVQAPPLAGPTGPTSRYVAAAITAAMAVGGFVAAWLYGRRIAARISVSADGRTLRIAQPTPFGMDERDIALSDVACAGVQAGDAAGEQTLAAGNLRVDVRGQRGFIVPLSGRDAKHERLMRLLQVVRAG